MISLHNFRGCARPPGRAGHPVPGRQRHTAPLPRHRRCCLLSNNGAHGQAMTWLVCVTFCSARRQQRRQHLPRSLNSASGTPEDEQEQQAEDAATAGEQQGPADLAAALSASDAQRPDAAADATAEVSFVTALRQRTRWAYRIACPLSQGMHICFQALVAI